MKCLLVMFVVVFAETALSDSHYDPSGWNSYFVMNSHDHIDAVDVVDPSGWNYDRESKSSIRNDQEDRKKQMVKFCESILEKKTFEMKSEQEALVENEVQIAVKSKIEAVVNQIDTRKENVAFAKRFISILLQSADLSQKTIIDGQDVSGFIEIKVSAEHLKTLLHFTNSIVNVSMRELDTILTASIHSSHNPENGIPKLVDRIFLKASQKEIWLPLFLVFIIFGVFQVIKTSQTTTRSVIVIILLIFTVAYAVEYYKMYKEIEIRQRITLEKHKDVPSSCSLKDRSLWTAIQNSFSSLFSVKNDECEQYYKAALLDPLVEVSPVRVLSNILSDFFLYPAGKIGKAIADFSSAVIGGLPLFYGWIVWLFSSIAFVVIVIFVLMISLGHSIRIHSWFGGVNVTRNHTSQIPRPPPEPAVTAAPAAPPLPSANAALQAVNGLSNYVLMDANSLGALLSRARSDVILHPSGVQELTNPSRRPLPSRPSTDKIDLTKIQLERSLSSIENTHPSSGECSNVKEKEETTSENMNTNIHEKNDSKSTDSPSQEELLVSFEVIQSMEIQSSSSETDLESKEVVRSCATETKEKESDKL